MILMLFAVAGNHKIKKLYALDHLSCHPLSGINTSSSATNKSQNNLVSASLNFVYNRITVQTYVPVSKIKKLL